MAERQTIIDAVESFYVDIIERYKDLEREIAGESKILTMFKKVDYKARVSRLKDLKRKVQSVNLKKIDISEDDELSIQVREKLGLCLSLFVKVIDAQVSCQTFLLRKSEGEKASMLDYKKAIYNVNRSTEELQNGMRSMDADYANLEEYE